MMSRLETMPTRRPPSTTGIRPRSLAIMRVSAVAASSAEFRQGTCSTVRDGAPPELHRDAQGCLTLVVTFFTLFGEDTSVTGTGSAGVETRVMHSELTTMPFPSGRNLTLNATSACGDGWAGWVSRSLSANAASENITAQNWSLTRTANGFRLDVMGVANLTIRLAVIELKVSK